jgi:hypothetical protein
MTGKSPNSEGNGDFVVSLEPAQVGALVALAISVIVLWMVARRNREP